MASSSTPVHEPRRLKPRWSVRHGRLSLAWGVTRPAERPAAARPAAARPAVARPAVAHPAESGALDEPIKLAAE